MTDQRPIEERIAERTDLTIAGSTAVSSEVGGLAFKDMGQVLEFSKLMAVSGQAVPRHLRGVPGACLAVSLQALNWRMDPFAVANKSYSVNDRIAYEAQLIHAVIEQRAPIKGRIKGRFEGEGATRKCILWATSDEDGEKIEYEGPEIGKITTKNSPLWKADPDQQLWYYSVRAMCRRHFPDVILGVYEKEEVESAPKMRDVTPPEGPNLAQRLASQPGEKIDTAPTAPESAQETDTIDGQADTPDEAETSPYETLDASDAAPGSAAWDRGLADLEEGKPISDCPYDLNTPEAVDYCGAYRMAARAKE